MWTERFHDKPRAEGVTVSNYDSLGVERGTVIHATRDFKALNFKEILEEHKVEQLGRFIQPHPSVGGWNKFIKTKITNSAQQSKRITFDIAVKKSGGQPKKKGCGWLHAK